MLKHKHVRETVRTFGLELIDLSPCNGSVFEATVQAGDGARQIIKINRDDGDKDRLTAQHMRQFANRHGKVTFPGKPVIPTVLQAAMVEASVAAQYAQNNPIPQPKDTPDMTTLSLAKPAAEPTKPRQKRVAISHIQFAQLANMVKSTDTETFDDLNVLAAYMTDKLGFAVAVNPLRDAMTMHGKKTRYQQARAAAKVKPDQVLAAAIAHLYTKLGEEMPAELKALL